jgi:hypothetical protein
MLKTIIYKSITACAYGSTRKKLNQQDKTDD